MTSKNILVHSISVEFSHVYKRFFFLLKINYFFTNNSNSGLERKPNRRMQCKTKTRFIPLKLTILYVFPVLTVVYMCMDYVA